MILDNNIYCSPEASDLTIIGEVDFSNHYEFDKLVLWQRADGVFVTGTDSGCSCPIPFQGIEPNELDPVYSLADLRTRLHVKQSVSDLDSTVDMDRLLTLARDKGLR